MHVLPWFSTELIVEAKLDKKFVYSSPFFHTGMPALFHHPNGFKSEPLFRPKLEFSKFRSPTGVDQTSAALTNTHRLESNWMNPLCSQF